MCTINCRMYLKKSKEMQTKENKSQKKKIIQHIKTVYGFSFKGKSLGTSLEKFAVELIVEQKSMWLIFNLFNSLLIDGWLFDFIDGTLFELSHRTCSLWCNKGALKFCRCGLSSLSDFWSGIINVLLLLLRLCRYWCSCINCASLDAAVKN